MRIPPVALALLALILVGALGGLFVAVRAVETAPADFRVPTTTNETFQLSQHRGQVVVIEFFGTTCAPCRIVEANLKKAAPDWNASHVVVLSIAVWGESLDELRQYQSAHNITWTIAQNADDANVKYNVFDIPHMVVLDPEGRVVFQEKGQGLTSQSPQDYRALVARAEQGGLPTFGIVQYGLVGLAMVAGAAAFFSPCAVGMLPAYVAHAVRRPTDGGGAARPFSVGAWAALGVLLVFFGIGGLALVVGPTLTRYVPFLQPLIGFLLITVGIFLLARPFSLTVQRWMAPLTRWAAESQAAGPSARSYFAYGIGYGAAAAGCTTPVLLSVFVTAAAYGPLVGTGIVLAYAVTGAFFMVLVTLAAATFREGLSSRLTRYARGVEIVSALLFVLGGAFLIWYALRAGTFAA